MERFGPATEGTVAAEARKLSTWPVAPDEDAPPGFVAIVEERFLVPTQCSPQAATWVFAHAALSLPLSLRGPVARLQAHVGQEPVRILCAGRLKRFPPLLGAWFGDVEPPQPAGTRWLFDPVPFERLEADLVLVEIHGWLADRFERRGWLVVPEVVRWRGDLEHVPPSPSSNSLRSDLRRIRRNRFTCEVGGDADDWRLFAQRMVFPLARARFGDEAWIASPRFLRELAKRGTILFVGREGRRVAGACVVPAANRLWLPLIGVLDGDAGLIADGAASAACAFSVDWAREHGFASVDWGRTAPFVNDGVQRYNRKWGLRAVPEPITHHVAVWISPARPDLRALYAREPVLVRRGGGLAVHAG